MNWFGVLIWFWVCWVGVGCGVVVGLVVGAGVGVVFWVGFGVGVCCVEPVF